MEQTNLWQKVQYTKLSDASPCPDAKGTKAIDGPALPALNAIGMQQSTPTQATIADTEWIMNFFHTYPNAHLQFFAGDMQLRIDSDAA
eukprot:13278000-Ditylum_brightwellii.AAC.1